MKVKVPARPAAERVPPGTPVDVLIDPGLSGLTVAGATISSDHLYVSGTGASTNAWVRVFRPETAPVLVAMAPLHAESIGRWTARALLPAEATIGPVFVDITDHPKEPWRGSPTRLVTVAVDAGADAARLTRLGDPRASTAWQRAATAWSTAGDEHRAEEAARLSVRPEVVRPDAVRSRQGPEDGPLGTDLAG
jgi:hypothetical protein